MKNPRFIVKLFLCGVGFLTGFISLSGTVSGRGGSPRVFQLTYEVRLPSVPEGAKELRIWIPLATSDRYQQIRKRVILAPYRYRITRDPQYGNDILFLDLAPPIPADFGLSIQYEAVVKGEPFPWTAATAADPTANPKKMKLDLQSNRLMVVDVKIRELAEAITAQARTPLEEVKAIYRYVIERMTYEKETPGWGRGDTLRACEVGTGNCTDFHSLFISLARARGIPARFYIGLPVPNEPAGEIPGYHCWAQVYLEGTGWIPVDASEAWKDRSRSDYFLGSYDPNRLAVSTGRDIQLVPKPANGPVNIFFKPYVEVDGKSFDGAETRFRFMGLTQQEGGIRDA